MLYTVANEDWTPESSLTAAETRSGLYRTRDEAAAISAGRRLLAVAVRYDDVRGVLTPSSPPVGQRPHSWSAPAIVGPSGGVTALAAIPAELIRVLGPRQLRIHGGHAEPERSFTAGRGQRSRSILGR